MHAIETWSARAAQVIYNKLQQLTPNKITCGDTIRHVSAQSDHFLMNFRTSQIWLFFDTGLRISGLDSNFESRSEIYMFKRFSGSKFHLETLHKMNFDQTSSFENYSSYFPYFPKQVPKKPPRCELV